MIACTGRNLHHIIMLQLQVPNRNNLKRAEVRRGASSEEEGRTRGKIDC